MASGRQVKVYKNVTRSCSLGRDPSLPYVDPLDRTQLNWCEVVGTHGKTTYLGPQDMVWDDGSTMEMILMQAARFQISSRDETEADELHVPKALRLYTDKGVYYGFMGAHYAIRDVTETYKDTLKMSENRVASAQRLRTLEEEAKRASEGEKKALSEMAVMKNQIEDLKKQMREMDQPPLKKK